MAKLTVKQDRFCQKYVELGDASAAYRAVYSTGCMKPATVNRNAKALLDDNKIAARISDLQEGHQQRHDITVDSLTEEIEQARKLAIRRGNSAAAVSACLAKAKLHGLIKRPRDLVANINIKGESLPEQGECILTALSEGQISIQEAANLFNALTSQARLIEITDLERRLSAIEEKAGLGTDN